MKTGHLVPFTLPCSRLWQQPRPAPMQASRQCWQATWLRCCPPVAEAQPGRTRRLVQMPSLATSSGCWALRLRWKVLGHALHCSSARCKPPCRPCPTAPCAAHAAALVAAGTRLRRMQLRLLLPGPGQPLLPPPQPRKGSPLQWCPRRRVNEHNPQVHLPQMQLDPHQGAARTSPPAQRMPTPRLACVRFMWRSWRLSGGRRGHSGSGIMWRRTLPMFCSLRASPPRNDRRGIGAQCWSGCREQTWPSSRPTCSMGPPSPHCVRHGST